MPDESCRLVDAGLASQGGSFVPCWGLAQSSTCFAAWSYPLHSHPAPLVTTQYPKVCHPSAHDQKGPEPTEDLPCHGKAPLWLLVVVISCSLLPFAPSLRLTIIQETKFRSLNTTRTRSKTRPLPLTCQRLGQRHHVWLHARVLVPPQLARAPQPALHLVKHKQRPGLVAQLAQALEELALGCRQEGSSSSSSRVSHTPEWWVAGWLVSSHRGLTD